MRNNEIATRSWVGIVLLSLVILLFGTGTAGAGPRILNVDFGDDNGYWVDLIVREVRVTPIVITSYSIHYTKLYEGVVAGISFWIP